MAGRTAFLVRVTDATEATAALAGGADWIGLSDARGALSLATVGDIVRTVAKRCPVSAAPAVLADTRDAATAAMLLAQAGIDLIEFADAPENAVSFAPVRARYPACAAAFSVWGAAGAATAALGRFAHRGFETAMLRTTDATRLTGHVGIDDLASFVGVARRHGFHSWLEGALEPPDVPRLLALEPDALAFRTALCRDGVRSNALDHARVAMVRELIPRAAPAATQSRGGPPGEYADRVFVRDFIVDGGVGAYRSEHSAPQRMRFNVDAEVAPIPADVADMRDVFSYDIIIDAIRLATRRHVLLVERIALDVAEATLRDPRVRKVRVRVEKLDVLPGAVGVEIERARGTRGHATGGADTSS